MTRSVPFEDGHLDDLFDGLLGETDTEDTIEVLTMDDEIGRRPTSILANHLQTMDPSSDVAADLAGRLAGPNNLVY